ncbi:hypothetical protein FB451DRAFT_1446568, partial [Mycena latifolia]
VKFSVTAAQPRQRSSQTCSLSTVDGRLLSDSNLVSFHVSPLERATTCNGSQDARQPQTLLDTLSRYGHYPRNEVRRWLNLGLPQTRFFLPARMSGRNLGISHYLCVIPNRVANSGSHTTGTFGKHEGPAIPAHLAVAPACFPATPLPLSIGTLPPLPTSVEDPIDRHGSWIIRIAIRRPILNKHPIAPVDCADKQPEQKKLADFIVPRCH